MIYSLAFQATYDSIELGLYSNNTRVVYRAISKIEASSQLLICINELLADHNLSLHDISFLTVNRGPGPFTTLRVVLATINGINFATKIPLCGIDGLAAFLDEYKNPQFPQTVALLNAFNNDLYFGIQKDMHSSYSTGCAKYADVFALIQKELPDNPITFIGNGTILYKDALKDFFGDRALVNDQLSGMGSIDHLAIMGLQICQQENSSTAQIMPLYLKNSA